MMNRNYSAFPKICKALFRWPDRVIGDNDDPYLLRWHVIPKNRFFNIYLHKFMRSDDDRALHDHPWSWNISLLLSGHYIEHMPKDRKSFGKAGDFRTVTKVRTPFRPVFRRGTTPHRVELYYQYEGWNPMRITGPAPVWTLFITGNNIREWGFYCRKGWVWWKEFVSERPGGNSVGRGCE